MADNSIAVTLGFDNTIQVWKDKTLKRTLQFNDGKAVCVRGKTILAVGGSRYEQHGSFSMWKHALRFDAEPRRYDMPGHEGIVFAVDAVGSVAVTGGSDGVRVWDLHECCTVAAIVDSSCPVRCALLRRAVAGVSAYTFTTGAEDGTILLWTLMLDRTARDHPSEPSTSDSLPSRYSLLAEDAVRKARDALSQTPPPPELVQPQCRGVLLGHAAAVLSLAQLGDLLASGGADNTFRLWDTASLQCIKLLQTDGPVACVRLRWRGPSNGAAFMAALVVCNCLYCHTVAAVADSAESPNTRSPGHMSFRMSLPGHHKQSN
eukprot:TRINITY_DN1604_c0_g5_i1.p1 TRINITY_DN1604_c0_g5~~TRINITY_DN1604_c0_g5_i1.p1  ORF type:complete len:343 (-),score=98.17 TRINITY_DN1604_c0_g5_i1:14-967(-)